MRKAFEEAIAILGENAKHSMIYELTVQAGVNFDDRLLTAGKLHEGLVQLYGKDTANVIMEEVLLKMDEVADQQMKQK